MELPEPNQRFRFPRHLRLRRQREFDRVYDLRCSFSDKWLVVYAAANEFGHVRAGFSVSKKLGNAVKRNRYKRLLREAFRQEQHSLSPSFDYVLIPRYREGENAKVDQYRASLVRLAALAVEKWGKEGRQKAEDGRPNELPST